MNNKLKDKYVIRRILIAVFLFLCAVNIGLDLASIYNEWLHYTVIPVFAVINVFIIIFYACILQTYRGTELFEKEFSKGIRYAFYYYAFFGFAALMLHHYHFLNHVFKVTKLINMYIE